MSRRPRPRTKGARLLRRVWTVLVLTPTLVVLSASRAVADSDVSRPAAALSWMELRDSRGISIWDYDLSLDRGGLTNPLKLIWSVFADIGWHVYTWLVGSAMWLIDFTLSFGWLEPFERPAEAVSDSLADVISRFGALPVLLTLAAAVAAVLMMAGRFATGLYEFFAAATVAALALGVLASPIDYVTGGDSWLVQARDLGLEVGGSLSAEPGRHQDADPEEIRVDLSEQLADIFIRAPHQLVNYNAVIDGTKCEDAYDAGLRMGHAEWQSTTVDGMPGYRLVDSATGEPIKLPPGTTVADLFGVSPEELPSHAKFNNVPEQRSLVEECDPALGDAAANPSFTQVINTLALGVGGIFLVILALALCLGVWASAIYTLVLAIKALWNLIAGILPGGQRLGLTRTISEVVIALIVVLAAVVFLMAYLQVVTSVFNSADGPPMKRFALLDLLLIAGLVVWLRMRKALKRAAATLAQKLAARPKSKPTRIGGAFGSGNRWQQARTIGVRSGRIAAAGGRGVATVGQYGRRAIGAGGMAGAAGVWAATRANNWTYRNLDQQPPPTPGDRADETAPTGEPAERPPPDEARNGPVIPGKGPDGPRPRHSAASLARQQAVLRQLSVRSHPASAVREHPRSRVPVVEPAAPKPTPVPAPAPTPRATAYDRVVSNGRVHYVRRAQDKPDRRDPTRVPS
jgi:hypothetical protein